MVPRHPTSGGVGTQTQTVGSLGLLLNFDIMDHSKVPQAYYARTWKVEHKTNMKSHVVTGLRTFPRQHQTQCYTKPAAREQSP